MFSFLAGKDFPESSFVFDRPADYFKKENEQRFSTDKAVLNEDVAPSGNLIFR